MLTFGQFPLNAPVTGDSTYDGIIDATAIGAFPFQDGLFLPCSQSRALLLDVNGSVVYDDTLLNMPRFTYGGCVSDGAVLLVGQTYGHNAFLGKVDSTGEAFEWVDSLYFSSAGSAFISAIKLSTGDLLNFGLYGSGGIISPLISRFSPNGSLIWHVHPYVSSHTTATHGRELDDGSILFTGNSGFEEAWTSKILCAKLTSTGDVVESTVVNNDGYSIGFKVIWAPNGNSTIFGTFTSGNYLAIASVDDNCLVNWIRHYDVLRPGDACLIPDSSGYMITGLRTGAGAFVARVDLNGDTAWTHFYGPAGTFGNRIRPDGFGGFLVTGSIPISTSNDHALWVLRVDGEGEVLGLRQIPSPVVTHMLIAPNPTNGVCWLHSGKNLASGTKWQLTDPLGRSVRLKVFNSSPYPIDMQGLENGTYFVQILEPGFPWKTVGPVILQK